MGNTADLATVQKTIIDTPHKESKSQRVITERGGCSRSAVSKHIKCKVDWKEEIGYENVHKLQGWPQAWEYCQAKPIQTLGRASQGVNWSWSQESPRSDIFRKRDTKPLLNQKHRQKHLTWAKEKKNKHVFVSWIQETLGNTLAACCWACVVHGDINEFQCLVCSALSGVYNDVTWVWVFRAERISWPVLSTRTCSWRRAILTFCPMAIFTPVTTGTAEQLENTEVKARQKRSLDDIVIPSNDREIHHLTKLRCVDR